MSGYSLSYTLPSGHESSFYWTPDRAEAQSYVRRMIDIFAETHQFHVTADGARQSAAEFLGTV